MFHFQDYVHSSNTSQFWRLWVEFNWIDAIENTCSIFSTTWTIVIGVLSWAKLLLLWNNILALKHCNLSFFNPLLFTCAVQAELQANWIQWVSFDIPLPMIRDYFGEQIALYFAWLFHYLKWLVPASVFGFSVYVRQRFEGTAEVNALPIYGECEHC